jgi:hypothetical protein
LAKAASDFGGVSARAGLKSAIVKRGMNRR